MNSFTAEKLSRVKLTNMPTGTNQFVMIRPVNAQTTMASADASPAVSGTSMAIGGSLSNGGTPATAPKFNAKVEIELPLYSYEFAIRKAAAGLLSNPGADIGWGKTDSMRATSDSTRAIRLRNCSFMLVRSEN